MRPDKFKIPDSYPIGKHALVKADGSLVGATVIDKFPKTKKAKRVRLQTGEHAGEVRMPHEYTLIEFV